MAGTFAGKCPPMTQKLAAITYLVRDYDEAIAWFNTSLGFVVEEDTPLADGKRWVRIAASRDGPSLVLAKAADEEQRQATGNAAGGRVAFFLTTDNFVESHARMLAAGVRFREEPRREPYGTVAVFEDLYGNGWDLIQPV
jgi:catechol 2,3-dioxygenase-like lactoylglutathione lyase family enzyme